MCHIFTMREAGTTSLTLHKFCERISLLFFLDATVYNRSVVCCIHLPQNSVTTASALLTQFVMRNSPSMNPVYFTRLIHPPLCRKGNTTSAVSQAPFNNNRN